MSSLLDFQLGAHKNEHKIRNTQFGSSLLLRHKEIHKEIEIKMNWGRNRCPDWTKR